MIGPQCLPVSLTAQLYVAFGTGAFFHDLVWDGRRRWEVTEIYEADPQRMRTLCSPRRHHVATQY